MKVLVLSNNCFAKNNSNGRVLGCLFKHILPENVAQFYILDGNNDFDICKNYYKVSDVDAIKSLWGKEPRGVVKKKEIKSNVSTFSPVRRKFGRSAFTMLCRSFIWKTYRWYKKDFDKWLNSFNPDVIVLQCGDMPFMYDFGVKLSKKLNIPLVLFNTEYYYFENNNWFSKGKHKSFLFRIYKNILKKSITRAINHSKISIYNSDWMKEQYDKVFNKPSIVIYQSSDLKLQVIKKDEKVPKIMYAGNLGYNRYKPLLEIADVLGTINHSLNVDIYGLAQSEEAELLLKNNEHIKYHGSVSYDKVKEELSKSDLLLVVESLEPMIAQLTKYGFTTKITDYLYSGIPILAYGPNDNVGISYLEKHYAAKVVFDRKDLENGLYEVLFNEEKKRTLVQNAFALADRNHNSYRNAELFKNAIQNILNES